MGFSKNEIKEILKAISPALEILNAIKLLQYSSVWSIRENLRELKILLEKYDNQIIE